MCTLRMQEKPFFGKWERRKLQIPLMNGWLQQLLLYFIWEAKKQALIAGKAWYDQAGSSKKEDEEALFSKENEK